MSTTAQTRLANRWIARLATVGLGAVLLVLGGFGIWAAVSATGAAADLERTRLLSNAYDRLRNALDDERLLEHQDALGHGGNFDAAAGANLAKQFERAAGEVDSALLKVRHNAGASDRELVNRIASVQGRYRNAMMDLFAAEAEGPMTGSRSDGGAMSGAGRRVMKLQEPLLDLQAEIKRSDRRHSREDLEQVRSLERSSKRTLRLTMVAFPLGLLLYGVFGLVLRGYRRRGEAARRAELAQLEQIALTDNLTGVRNNRAFHEDLARELSRMEREGGHLSLVMLDMDGLKEVNDRLGHQEGDDQLRALAACMVETVRSHDLVYRVGGDEFALILTGANGLAALRLVQRLLTNLSSGTRVNRPSASAGLAEMNGPLTAQELVRRADVALYDAKRSGQHVVLYASGLEGADRDGRPTPERTERHMQLLATTLARAVDLKDSDTRSHCETVAELAALMAEELGLDSERVARLRMAALVHDVGKIGISDAILKKPGPLTDEEREVMKTHAALGSGILGAAGLDDEALWILHHHERFDGAGYPAGLSGSEIPLESRILFVADAFEAITGRRCYSDPQDDDQALAELERNAGSQFDPDCVAALQRVMTKASDPSGPATLSDAR